MTGRVLVRRSGGNTLRTETVPVVFVPGVMGSRLTFADGAWDPDSNGNMIGWATNWVSTTQRKLSLDNTGEVTEEASDSDTTEEQVARGWGGVSWTFYGQFLQDLEGQTFARYRTPVYAVGYDWRQSNRDSGSDVAARIGEILEETGATRFILVSHSMGGLVTRAMLKDDAGVAGKLVGVVHMAQPALGAAVFYRRMFTGARAGADGGTFSPAGIVFRNILGTSRSSFQSILSVLPGPMQLMVHPRYRDTGGADWLTITPFENPQPQGVAVSWATYLGASSPAGLIAPANSRHALDEDVRAALRARLEEAQGFHDWLGEYKHDRTWSIYGNGIETDMGCAFDLPPEDGDEYRMVGGGFGSGPPTWYARRSDGRTFHYPMPDPDDRGCVLVRRDEGDGTVPAPSAQALFPGQAHAVAVHTTDYEQRRQFEVTGGGAVHDAICHHPQAEACLFDIMRHLLGTPP